MPGRLLSKGWRRGNGLTIDWSDFGQLWNASPRDAIELWKAIRLEARDEFISGHHGARAFESADYMHEALKRAEYLAIRDGLIEEWRPGVFLDSV
jgi:hypothetical protein